MNLHRRLISSYGPAPGPEVSYATWNPADKGSGVILTNGNLTTQTEYPGWVRSTIGVSSGKHYWEVRANTTTPSMLAGVATSAGDVGNWWPGLDPLSWSLYWSTGQKDNNNTLSAYYGGGAIPSGMWVGVKLNMDDHTLGYIVDGIDQGVAFSLPSSTIYAAIGSVGAVTADTNFGQVAFDNAVPLGFRAGLSIDL